MKSFTMGETAFACCRKSPFPCADHASRKTQLLAQPGAGLAPASLYTVSTDADGGGGPPVLTCNVQVPRVRRRGCRCALLLLRRLRPRKKHRCRMRLVADRDAQNYPSPPATAAALPAGGPNVGQAPGAAPHGPVGINRSTARWIWECLTARADRITCPRVTFTSMTRSRRCW